MTRKIGHFSPPEAHHGGPVARDERKMFTADACRHFIDLTLKRLRPVAQRFTGAAHSVPDLANAAGGDAVLMGGDFAFMPAFEVLCRRVARVRKEFDPNFRAEHSQFTLAAGGLRLAPMGIVLSWRNFCLFCVVVGGWGTRYF